MSLEKIIRDALTAFIQSRIPNADLSAMDEVFFSYVTGVLEELGSQDSSDEDFDMETFMEMLEGYIPGFADIDSETVYEMMFELSGRLNEARNNERLTVTSETSPTSKESGGIEPRENGLPVVSEGAEAQVLQKIPKKEDLKEFILQKYMLVDDNDDKKTHKPLMPKEAPKKMIRYIDNQVVSTKGERYKDMKKPESEEMKKTYINLKPARKYKFH
ncbi:CUE domain-containing protein 2 isoform X2 [Phyllobates terribilis]|uniref:CUE domain-containing protein 2 isoform X2 n=1 Tax=Phyllobates terribilis TaxID=111132 RepID=UPI003CCB453E